MKNPIVRSWLVILLTMFNFSAMAEDIDLFVQPPPSTADVPNVLIVLDNTANWTSPFANEKAALISVFDGLPVDKFRVGLMFFTETGSPNSNIDGGYMRAAIRLMNDTNKPLYSALINGLDVGDDKSNGGKAGLTMAEAYYYFNGSAPRSGKNKVKTDYAGNVASGAYLANSRAVWAKPNNALASFAGTPYNSPIVSGCAKNYIIYISNGAVQDNNSDTATATTLLSSAGGSTSAIPISPSGSQDNIADEWARFMKKSNHDITTYTVDVNKVTTGQGPGWTALLRSMASVGGGKYFDVTSSGNQIADALNNIFSEIQSVNSVFSSVSLPVSVNTQGTYLNQVYVGMFRPDQNSFPRWFGNLKQYKLGFDGSVLKLLDADDGSAISSTTGFIAECARSFWSTPDTYWNFPYSIQGGCLNTDVSNAPDGNIVEKGAQAQVLRSNTARNVKTCTPGSCTTLNNFNNTNVTSAMLGVATTTERDALINWARGLDLKDENINAVTSAEMRPSSHGDVVHSRPVAINYGTDASPQVVVFYGGNDGVLRAVNGNRTAAIGSVVAGGELWSFVAPEFYTKIKRIYDNTTTISFPGHTTGTPTPQPKDYGVDGPVTAYKEGANAYIFSTMRRGGNAVYAFNVSSPASPTLMWRKDASSLTGLGQTWSSPKVLKANGYGSPLLIMGGGYDTCQDADPNVSCNASSNGTKIYVINAVTGAVLQTFNTDSSVVADITVVEDGITGYVKYAYAADLGGNVYRISGGANSAIGAIAPGGWTMTKVAALGGGGSDNRKFMFAPDVVAIDSDTYALLLGSGDREKPLTSYTGAMAVNNYFFMIRDKPTDTGWLASESSNCGANVICKDSLVAITSSATPTAGDLVAKKGWYLGLTSSEQVVTSAITVFGTVTFSTHQPAGPVVSGSCSSTLGTATVYNINYTNAAPLPNQTDRGAAIVGGGLPPSPVAGRVTLDDGRTVPFIIGANPKSALEGGTPPAPPSVDRPKGRVYWNIKK